ncbi:RLA class II histocompatibility antigen, DP beta chain [Varanus komodoensis]|nr:RLA class II histocompatibility antigen, DP beta chain [Varanus komodoensis]
MTMELVKLFPSHLLTRFPGLVAMKARTTVMVFAKREETATEKMMLKAVCWRRQLQNDLVEMESKLKYKRTRCSASDLKSSPRSISPTKDDPLFPCTLLLCTATSFYPWEIEVHWLKNGQRATEGVFYGEELHNGDWMYQTQVMLEDTPQHGDVYACQVEHASLETPIIVQ